MSVSGKKRKFIPAPEGFTSKPHRPCLDCLLRDDLDPMGNIRKNRYHRVIGCMGCDGSARVARENSIDPYFTGRR